MWSVDFVLFWVRSLTTTPVGARFLQVNSNSFLIDNTDDALLERNNTKQLRIHALATVAHQVFFKGMTMQHK